MELYTSRLTPRRRTRQVEIDLSSLYELHRTLSLAFPELPKPISGDTEAKQDADEARKEVRCLFRVDETRDGPMILVQSRVEPDWRRLQQAHPQYLHTDPEVKAWKPNIPVGTSLRFRLRANPTVKRDGKRIPLRSEEEQLLWIGKQAGNHGFSLPLRNYRKPDGRMVELPFADTEEEEAQRNRHGTATTTHHAVQFDGVLRVTDPEVFSRALAGGVGPAKGFGFGLLSVARLA